MNKDRKLNIDKTRNNRFAEAFDLLRRDYGIKTQVELAKRMGVNKDTITNILRYKTPVSEDVITKLQTAFRGVFNLQWLRGESDVMLAEHNNKDSERMPRAIEPSSMVNAIIASNAEAIASLKRELATQNRMIELLEKTVEKQENQIRDKEQQIQELKDKIAQKESVDTIKDYPFPPGVADDQHSDPLFVG